MNRWSNRSWSNVVKIFNSDGNNGLKLDQVEKLKSEGKVNKVVNFKPRTITQIILKQIKNIWFLMMFINPVILLILGEFIYSILNITVLVTTVSLLTLKEYKKENEIKEMGKLIPSSCRVVRGGKILRINPEDLVLGDIVFLDKHDICPADLRLIENDKLKVKETIITGENLIVEKYETKIEARDIPLTEMNNIVFKSSIVVDGSGTGIVVAIGEDTEIGKIINMLLEEEKNENSFKNKLYKLLNSLGLLSILGWGLILLEGLFNKRAFEEILYNGAVISKSLLCEGAIIIVFLFSYIISKKLKNKGITFKDISAIDSLTKTNLLITDKVSVYSEEKMTVKKIYTEEKILVVNEIEKNENISKNLERIINISLLCNEHRFNNGKGENSKIDLIEIGLCEFGLDYGIDKTSIDRTNRRIFVIPFDFDRRIKTTVNKTEKKYRANLKGAVDVILNSSTHIMKNGVEVEITDEDKTLIRNSDMEMCKEALNVIAVAYRNFNYEPSIKENIESNLVFVGLIGFENKIKEDVYDTLYSIKDIKPLIITEDTKLTSIAMANDLKLINNDDMVLSGIEIDNMEEDEFKRNIEKITVFSRISLDNKNKIVKTLKEKGNTITLVGSKLIDLPCLKAANIGIAIGENSSNIVKKLCDIVIKDGSLSNINYLINVSKTIMNSIYKTIKSILILSAFKGFISIILLWFNFKFILEYYYVITLDIIFMPLVFVVMLLWNMKPERFKKLLRITKLTSR